MLIYTEIPSFEASNCLLMDILSFNFDQTGISYGANKSTIFGFSKLKKTIQISILATFGILARVFYVE